MAQFSGTQANNGTGMPGAISEQTKTMLKWLLSGDEEAVYRKLRWRVTISPEIFYDEAIERTIAQLEEKKRDRK